MSATGTGHAPHADATAEAQALIAEARARTRRRRRRIALAVACAAALAVGSLAAAGRFSGSPTGAGTRTASPGAPASLAGPPRYFLDAPGGGGGYGWLEIRASASGKLVAQPRFPEDLHGYDPPYGLAATGPNSFVVGMMTPSDCSTQFFRLQVDDQGRPGALTRFGPTLPGELVALTASAGGGLLGYAIDDSGCNQSATSPGAYVGVLDVHSGRTTQWTQGAHVNPLLDRIGQLSMSANGRLLAFTQSTGTPAHGGVSITGMQVRVLPTDAPPGTVAQRSRVVARTSTAFSGFGATSVLLSPSGTSFYLCSEPMTFPPTGSSKVVETARVVAFRTATGKQGGVIAAFSLSFTPPRGVSYHSPSVGCGGMALDPSGRFLLVPYQDVPLNMKTDNSATVVGGAVINTATGARSTWTLHFGTGTMPSWSDVAW